MSRWILILTVGVLAALATGCRHPSNTRTAPAESKLTAYLQQGFTLKQAEARLHNDEENAPARDQQRQKAKAAGTYDDVWKREDELRGLIKSLRVGMTAQEVAALLGKPTRGGDPANVPRGNMAPDAPSFLPFGGYKHRWMYSPHPTEFNFSYGMSHSFQVLSLGFDNDNRLKGWLWLAPVF
jgi:hypothetical protein